MAEYGVLLDVYDEERDNFYKYFVKYFDNPIFTKLKDVDGFSMYIVKTLSLLSNEYRYIIVIINKDQEKINTLKKLDKLYWVSLQTRTWTENINCSSHTYTPIKQGELDSNIFRIENEEKMSKYKCENFENILITLLQNNTNQYQNKGSLINAIETYQTVIDIIS